MTRLRTFLLVIIYLASILSLHAEEKSYTSQYLLSYPITIEKEIVSPLHWDSKDWITAGSVAAIGTGLYLADYDIMDWVQENRNHFTHETAVVAKLFGEGKYMLPAASIVWLGGYVTDSGKTRDTGLLLIKSMLIAGGTTQVLKYATQRTRPVKGEGKEFWLPGGFSKSRESFPSGHATIAFSAATVLAEQYNETRWVPTVAYSAATLTACSRVHDERHWASDVFIGAAIGYYTAQFVMKTTPRLEIAPAPEIQGVGFRYEF